MSLALTFATRNKQMLALLAIALLTAIIITTIVLSFVFHFNVWSIFIPGEATQIRYG
jgi:hypothetical protein